MLRSVASYLLLCLMSIHVFMGLYYNATVITTMGWLVIKLFDSLADDVLKGTP